MRDRSLSEMELVALDTETTGLFPSSGRLLEIGAVRFRLDGTVVGEYQQLVDPGEPVAPLIQQITGISDAMVAGQPDIAAVLPGFVAFLGVSDTLVMAHNAAFDLGFLATALSRSGLALPPHDVLDTLSMSRRLLPRAPNHKLETLCTLLSVPPGTHRALADAHAVRALFTSLLRDRPQLHTVRGLKTVAPLLTFAEAVMVAIEAPLGFETLAQAAAEGRAVTIVYDGGSKGCAPRSVTPLSLVQAGGVSYLMAVCHIATREKQFRLDRIREVR